jgi:hypothetical protein
MMIPLFFIMDVLGLLDSWLGLVFVYSTTAIPFCVWMLKGYFDTIPKDLEESALIRRSVARHDLLENHLAAGEAGRSGDGPVFVHDGLE